MGESAKALLALGFIIGVLGTVFVWTADNVGLPARLGFPLGGLVSLAFLLWALRRKDKVPDFLSKRSPAYFERDGFCFAIIPEVEEDRCRLDVYFQNRYERPCRAQVVIQPSRQFLLNRRSIESATVEIDCGEAAFGVTRIPWPVPRAYQGRTQSFDIGANVTYPEGKGAMLRYRDGKHVRQAQVGVWRDVATLAAASGGAILLAGGMLVAWKPARFKFRLPNGVAEDLPGETPITTETLWRLGDQEPKKVSGTFMPEI